MELMNPGGHLGGFGMPMHHIIISLLHPTAAASAHDATYSYYSSSYSDGWILSKKSQSS
jgi:hypothetical protein